MAGSGARFRRCQSFAGGWNSWKGYEWGFPYYNFAWPSAQASRSSSNINERHNKCWALLYILWECTDHPYTSIVSYNPHIEQKEFTWIIFLTIQVLCIDFVLLQGLTYPVAEMFLEDVVEKTRYKIKSEFDNFQGNSRRRRRQLSTKNDPLTELFEVNPNS